MPARVSAFARWHSGVVESRKTSIDFTALDRHRQEVLSQEELYENSVRPFVTRCLQGCSGSIITYGAWGSGKSYTLGTLDPQQLALASRGNDSPGVLSRCTQQLFEWLGQGASVEITCVEVQGDDVLDLLDSRTGAAPCSRSTANESINASSSSISSLYGCGSPGPALASPQGAFSRSPIAAAAASASRRKPLTIIIARSPTEALLTLKRAVSNRQAFATTTRQNSSRTHAVFQLRWRNPSGPAAGGNETSSRAGAAAVLPGRVSGAGAVQRACSAPPRSSLPGASAGCAATDAQGTAGGAGGPVCTLTLIDTCSFCPLLPPKEGSAVKRSLLALSRVLSALQRRNALTLRESKLTRMLEGALDQVLVLACLGGTGDEPTVQLVKMLQQGVPRDSTLRRSRRASSSDSRHASGAWESAASLCGVSAATLGGGTGSHPAPCTVAAAKAVARTPPKPTSTGAGGHATCTSPLQGLGPSRALFQTPPSPSVPGHRTTKPIAATSWTDPAQACNLAANRHDSAGKRSSGAGAVDLQGSRAAKNNVSGGGGSSGAGRNSSSGGGATDTDAAALHPMSDSSLDVSSSSPAASSQGADDGGDGPGSATTSTTVLAHLSAAPKTSETQPLSIQITGTDTQLCSPDGTLACGVSSTPVAEKRAPLSGGRHPGGSIPSPPGCLRASPHLASKRQKPASVTARASPGPEVRRSQGFSVLLGKWAPPQPIPQRDTSFPVVPCIVQNSITLASMRSVRACAATSASTESLGTLADSERQPREPVGTKSRALRAPPGPEFSDSGSNLAPTEAVGGTQLEESRCPEPADNTDGAGGYSGAVSIPFTSAPEHPPESYTTPKKEPHSHAHSTPCGVDTAATALVSRGAASAACSSPAAATPTSARRKSSIPARTVQVRSPQLGAHSPQPAASNVASASPSAAASRATQRGLPVRPPSPMGGATLISLAAVPPTRLASMRYGSANISHDSVQEDLVAAASEANPAGTKESPTDPRIQMSLRLQQQDTVTTAFAKPSAPVSLGGFVAVAKPPREGVPVPEQRRSISTGLRWPSPLLRARREEWLADMRRSRSAQSRRIGKAEEVEAGSVASPRQRPHVFRCAQTSRPTLSAQYKDLLLDFKAFKARGHTPRHRRTSVGSAPAQPITTTDPPVQGSPTLAAARVPESTNSSAGSGIQTHGSVAKQGPTILVARAPGGGGNVNLLASMLAAPAGSPAGSTVAPGSPASMSTPHSSRAPSGSCPRPPPPAFSRVHSPRADEGLLSLTAAAAAAAAAASSPRNFTSAGPLTSGRSRPGVIRAVGTTASPRPLRSPERPSTPISPVTVLDMSRLCIPKGSPTGAATPSQLPGSGRSRLSVGSAATAPCPGQLTSGGSDRYRQLTEEDGDSVATSETEMEGEVDGCQTEGGSYPSGESDSDRDNLLGPSCLGNLGLMLDACGNPSALRESLSQIASSGLTSPAGVSSARPTPSSARRTPAANAAPRTWRSENECDVAGEELPAVSFFIHRFTPRTGEGQVVGPGSARRNAAISAAARPAAAGGSASGRCTAAEASRGGVGSPSPSSGARKTAAGTARVRAALRTSPGYRKPSAIDTARRSQASAEDDFGLQEPQLDHEVDPQPERRPHHARRHLFFGAAASAVRTPGAVAAAAAAAVAELAELQRSYISRDRTSGDSGVLRGSCTTSSLNTRLQADDPDREELAQLERLSGHAAVTRQDQPRSPGLMGVALGKTVIGPPSHSSISLRQLLEQQQQILQQRPGRRTAGWLAAAATMAAVEAMGCEEPKGPIQRRDLPGGFMSPPLAANRLLAQRAHVRPNHMDLDEHSTVLVDVDSASESDAVLAGEVSRGKLVLGHRNSRLSLGVGGVSAAAMHGLQYDARVTSPVRPGLPMPEQSSMLRVASPVKPSPTHSPQLPPPMSVSPTSVRARVAAIEAQRSSAGNTVGPHTPRRLMKSWAQEGDRDGTGQHPSDTAAAAAASTQSGSADGGRPISLRSAPFAALTTPLDAIFEMLNKQLFVGGSGDVLQHGVPSNPPGHQRHASAESGVVDRAGGSQLLRGGLLSRSPVSAAAVGTAVRPPAAPQVQVVRSIDEDTCMQRASPAHAPSQPLIPAAPPPPQHQQTLRASGNVAAAWRAAAAMSTSSSSSVRSCFRSSSGQQQHSILGSDATAVATVVAVSRAAPVCNLEEKHSQTTANGHVVAVAPAGANKMNSVAEQPVPSPRPAITSNPFAGAATTTPTSAAAASAISVANANNPSSPPPLPPHPGSHPFVARSPRTGAYVPPLVLPMPAAGEASSAATAATMPMSSPFLGKTKSSQSARVDRMTPLTARLRACKSQRTPRTTTPTAPEDAAEPQQPPPPAYPPGFISWAAKLFSGSRKSKQVKE